MDALEQFYYDNAGYSYNPATETAEEGRVHDARQLAMAERFAAFVGIRYEWQDDWEIGNHAEYFCADAYPDNDGNPETCEMVSMWNAGELVGSLGCVDDAGSIYRRVVEAELASEYLSERLEYLRGEINGQCISWFELVELESLAPYIDPSDVQLLEWAGVPEHNESE